jgi:hypothetical protein
MSKLRNDLIKLAYENPDIRPSILPLLAPVEANDRTAGSNAMAMDLLGAKDIQAFSRILRKSDPAMYKMFRNIVIYFGDKFDRNEEQAYNMLRNMMAQPGDFDLMKRNQLAKIADLLGMRTPLDF